MNTTSLHVKVEDTIKQQAQETADELGLSLSAVVKVLLKQFIRTRQLSISLDEEPTLYMTEALKQSEEDVEAGRVTSFETPRDALEYLKKEITDEKQRQSSH